MQHYQTIVAFHIIFAGIWIIFFAADLILKNKIRAAINSDVKNELISIYLQFTNLFGIVGSVGIAITGITLVVLNPGWGFFDMSHAHWLATKQIIFVGILFLTFMRIIPTAKKLRAAMHDSDTEEINNKFNSVANTNKIINILVILNLVFALTHRFYS